MPQPTSQMLIQVRILSLYCSVLRMLPGGLDSGLTSSLLRITKILKIQCMQITSHLQSFCFLNLLRILKKILLGLALPFRTVMNLSIQEHYISQLLPLLIILSIGFHLLKKSLSKGYQRGTTSWFSDGIKKLKINVLLEAPQQAGSVKTY